MIKEGCITILFFLVILTGLQGQTYFKVGGGYYGENVTNPGVVLEFELEKLYTEDFSLPLRADMGYHSNPDFNAFIIDLHKGFRKYFKSGLFLEQSLGAGVIIKTFKEEDYWFVDQFAYTIPHGNGAILGFMPSVTAGAGYNISKNSEWSNLVWIRPKVYWDLGFRSLHLPYFALQAGYTHTFKIK